MTPNMKKMPHQHEFQMPYRTVNVLKVKEKCPDDLELHC